ncbi:NAD(P)/FAD-dependent oxidoreductase [Candidatus Micrarchaeota archaeon]|nr:NAD(P)/FAD-dependent oxidoreductase [Candidatus Micrarchaeota archaeon]
MPEEFDVIVIGGGPSGSCAATFLSKAGKRVLLLDRATFPREKVCGDGISGSSVGILKEMGLLEKVNGIEHADMYGVTFSSPNGTVVHIPAKRADGFPPGFVCRREVFDNLLFQNAKSLCSRTIEGFLAEDFIRESGAVKGVRGSLDGKPLEFRAKVVVCADGAAGMTARKLGVNNASEAHQFAGIRAYYDNVLGMADRIEIHFVDGALPGYFWIFPLPGKRANVGLCMLVCDMKKRKVNLQALMNEIIAKNPIFAPRFKDSKRESPVKSWLLPVNTRKPKAAGNGYVLVGDTASLIDPFMGEGIGNALTSGKLAAKTILRALDEGDFSEKSLSRYDDELNGAISRQVKQNYRLQKMASSAFLTDFIIGRAKRSKYVQAAITDSLLDAEDYTRLTDPLFPIKALFL